MPHHYKSILIARGRATVDQRCSAPRYSAGSRQPSPVSSAVVPLLGYALLLLRPEMDPAIPAPVSQFYITSAAVQMSITVLSVWLLISTLPADRRIVPALAGRPALLLTLWTVLLLGIVVAGMLNPALVAWVPVDRTPLRYVTAVGTIMLLLATGFRYWRSWRYSRFPLQRAITCAVGFILAIQAIVSTGTVWNISWWIYQTHGAEMSSATGKSSYDVCASYPLTITDASSCTSTIANELS